MVRPGQMIREGSRRAGECLKRLWNDDRAAEIAEWVVAVAFIAITAVAIYRGILVPQLSSTLDTAESSITAAASGNTP